MYLAPACTLWLFLGIMTLEYRTMVVRRWLRPLAMLAINHASSLNISFQWRMANCHSSGRLCAWLWVWRVKQRNAPARDWKGRTHGADLQTPHGFCELQAEGAFQLMAGRPLAYCAAAGMGFCVNALAYIVIQTSSSLTLKACTRGPRPWGRQSWTGFCGRASLNP